MSFNIYCSWDSIFFFSPRASSWIIIIYSLGCGKACWKENFLRVGWSTCTYFRLFLSQPLWSFLIDQGCLQSSYLKRLQGGKDPSRVMWTRERVHLKYHFPPNSAFRGPATSPLPTVFCCCRDFSPVPMLVLLIHPTLDFVTSLAQVSVPSYQNAIHCSRPSSGASP